MACVRLICGLLSFASHGFAPSRSSR
jgi:hypothetical protein